MGEKVSLELQPRDIHGKKVARLRREGMVPAVVYGSGLEPMSVMAPLNVMEKVYKDAGKHHPVHLSVDSKRRIAMIKDVDHDPVKRTIRHISFHAVKQNEQVEAEVPIVLIGEGESEAEKAGLIVLQTLETVAVKALPMSLPDQIEVSIVDLAEAGQHVSMSNVKLPEGVEYADADAVEELVIASVYEPSALQADMAASGGDAQPGDEADIESEEGGDTDQGSQEAENRPGGKGQDDPKQSNIDANS